MKWPASVHAESTLFNQLRLIVHEVPPKKEVPYFSKHSNVPDAKVVVAVVVVVGVVVREVVTVVVAVEVTVVVGVVVSVVVTVEVAVVVAVVVVSTARMALTSTPSITTTIPPLETSADIASAPSVDVIVTTAWIPDTPRRERCLPLATHATRNALIAV